jgi:hypothetical protein
MSSTAIVEAPKATPTTQCLDKHIIGQRLTVSSRTAARLMRTGQIKSVLIGRKRIASEKALEEFIRKNAK